MQTQFREAVNNSNKYILYYMFEKSNFRTTQFIDVCDGQHRDRHIIHRHGPLLENERRTVSLCISLQCFGLTCFTPTVKPLELIKFCDHQNIMGQI